MGRYVLGERVKMTATFTVDDVATDPVNPVCRVKAPDGTETTPSVTPEAGDGVVSAIVDTDQVGVWRYRFEADPPTDAPGEGQFSVRTIYTP